VEVADIFLSSHTQLSVVSHTPVPTVPLKPRLERMLRNTTVAQTLQSHISSQDATTPIFDIHQSPVWKRAYDKDDIFKDDPRGISLALCTDGVNPFAHNKVQYSMWPVMLTILNLPRRLRNRFSSIMLVGKRKD